MGEYQDVLTKLKSTAKPGTAIGAKPNMRPNADAGKTKSGQDGEDTPKGGVGIKRPAPTSRPVTATKQRSDSKESS